MAPRLYNPPLSLLSSSFAVIPSSVPSYTTRAWSCTTLPTRKGSKGDGRIGCGRETRPLIFHYKCLHILIWGLIAPHGLKKQPLRYELSAFSKYIFNQGACRTCSCLELPFNLFGSSSCLAVLLPLTISLGLLTDLCCT